MRNTTKTVALVVALAMATLTAGCSVGIVDQGDGPDTPHSTAPVASPSEPGTASGVGEEGAAGQDAAETPGREQILAAVSKVMRCDGEQIMLEDEVILSVEGPCDRLILNTRGSQVLTDDVGYLEVIGDGNVVLSGRVDKLLVNGRGNVVHWNGPTPTVQDVGSENVLTAE